MRLVSSFPIIPPQIITTRPLYWRRIPIIIVESPSYPLVKPSVSFGDALDSSVKRTVFMFVLMQFHDHSMQKCLFLVVREGILIKLLIEATIPMVWLRVVYALFGSLASLIIIPLICSRHSVYVFFNRFISRIENKFKPPQSDRDFLVEGFSQKFLHFHLFLSSQGVLFFHKLIYLFWLWLFLL